VRIEYVVDDLDPGGQMYYDVKPRFRIRGRILRSWFQSIRPAADFLLRTANGMRRACGGTRVSDQRRAR